MKAKFGAIVVDGRGKIGGHVASKNRAGSYFRTKVTPVNPRNPAQTVVRNIFGFLSQMFRSLDEENIAAWNAAVSQFQTTNVFGDLKTPSGFNLFQRLNNNLVRIGLNPIQTPPVPDSVAVPTLGTITAMEEAQTLSIAYTGGDIGTVVEVYATPGISPGVSYVKNQFRKIGQFEAETASPFVATAGYVAKFGAIPASGLKVHVMFKGVSETSGLMSAPQTGSTVVEFN